MDQQRLAYMANQIARNFAAQGEDAAIAQTAEHIRLFWDARMKEAITAHLRAGGEGLDPVVKRALGGV